MCTTLQLFRGLHACPEVLNHSLIMCSLLFKSVPALNVFFPKQCVHTGGFFNDNGPVFDQGAPSGLRHFFRKFSSDMSMCILTAQPRANSAARLWAAACFL